MSGSVRQLSVIDSAFVFAETTETPMHVGSLSIVKLPENYAGDYFEDLKRMFVERLPDAKMLTLKLAQTPFDVDRPSWVEDDAFDINRHIFRTQLAEPRDRSTLLRMAGWLHAKPLNRARPLWEAYVFTGLPDNEAAIYTKLHHALVDGGGAVELAKTLYDITPTPRPPGLGAARKSHAKRPEVRDIASSALAAYAELWRAPFSKNTDLKAFELPRTGGTDLTSVLVDAAIHNVEWSLRFAANMPEILDSVTKSIQTALKPEVVESFRALNAPSTPLNVAISSERSFAGVTLPLGRVKAVAKKAGGKVNDVVLALSSGVLRRYLLEIDALPRKTMTGFVPISARDEGNAEAMNQVFGMVVPLATDIENVAERFKTILEMTAISKEIANPFRPILPHIMEAPSFGTPMIFQLMATFYGRSNLANSLPPPVNVVISNVFLSKFPFYIAGARLEHVFPMSIVVHGQALNITVQGYCDNLDFGFTGAANVLPNMEELTGMMDRELVALEKAFAVSA